MYTRFPTKINSMAHIKQFMNNDIKTIIDIGVLTSTYDLMKVFKEEKHVLIEPVPAFQDIIKKNYRNHNYDLYQLALSNKKGKQSLELLCHRPSCKLGKEVGITASQLLYTNDNIKHENRIDVDTDTIDNICIKYKGPILVKLDVDGAEFEILKGANKSLDKICCFVIESWVSRIADIINVMKEKNFVLWDIVDLCYLRGQLSQVDLVFVNPDICDIDKYKEFFPRKYKHTSDQEGNFKQIDETILVPDKITKLNNIKNTGNL